MPHYTYLIIGSGMTADSAVKGIRQVDPNGSIGMMSTSPYPPYNAPPLSKGLWKKLAFERIWRKTENLTVEFHLNCTATLLDIQNKQITDDQGTTFTFDKLLLATGGSPRQLPFGKDEIIYFRTLDDYKRLRSLTDTHQKFAVMGGGFIGSEVATVLSLHQKQVVMLFPEAGIGWRAFPPDLSEFLNNYYRQKGVEILAGEMVAGLEKQGDTITLKTQSGKTIQADGVVAGLGILPGAELAKTAGLTVENGIVVDELLRTSHPEIYAAGDVANFYSPALGKRIRVEHEDNANTMGSIAGQNMAGSTLPYHHIPYFYSDYFDLIYQGVGELDSRLEMVVDWQEPYRKGVIYYLDKGRVRGVLLWNILRQIDEGRRLIADPGPFKPEDLKGKIPK